MAHIISGHKPKETFPVVPIVGACIGVVTLMTIIIIVVCVLRKREPRKGIDLIINLF